ncbi:MAG TPA: hypothetical protein VGA20_11700 [Gemmatimonadales bacterium]
MLPLLAYAAVAVLWPGSVDVHRRGKVLLLTELVAVAIAVTAGVLLAKLAMPSPAGLRWGRYLLLTTAYLYVCGRGVVIVRAVLELPVLQLRREEDRSMGAIEIARGRTVGVLERALALSLVLLGQYGALGLVVAAKSLARFKALDDRDFAEYFLIGTLASLLVALAGGVVVRALL